MSRLAFERSVDASELAEAAAWEAEAAAARRSSSDIAARARWLRSAVRSAAAIVLCISGFALVIEIPFSV